MRPMVKVKGKGKGKVKACSNVVKQGIRDTCETWYRKALVGFYHLYFFSFFANLFPLILLLFGNEEAKTQK